MIAVPTATSAFTASLANAGIPLADQNAVLAAINAAIALGAFSAIVTLTMSDVSNGPLIVQWLKSLGYAVTGADWANQQFQVSISWSK